MDEILNFEGTNTSRNLGIGSGLKMSDFCVYHIGIFTTVTLLSRRRWSARCQPGSIRAGSLTVEGKGSERGREGGRKGGAPSLSDSFVTVAAEAEAGVAQGAAAAPTSPAQR